MELEPIHGINPARYPGFRSGDCCNGRKVRPESAGVSIRWSKVGRYKQFKNVYHWKLYEEDPQRKFTVDVSSERQTGIRQYRSPYSFRASAVHLEMKPVFASV